MNELANVPISPWYTIPAAVGLLALTFVFAPGVLLYLGVLIYPKGHARRKEFTAELYAVPYFKRPFWVAANLVRCIFEGVPERFRANRVARTDRGTGRLQPGITYEEYGELLRRVMRFLEGQPKKGSGRKVLNFSMAYTDARGNAWIIFPGKLTYRGDEINLDGIKLFRRGCHHKPERLTCLSCQGRVQFERSRQGRVQSEPDRGQTE